VSRADGDPSTSAAVFHTLVGAALIMAATVVALGLGVLARHHAEAEVFSGAEKVEVHESSYRIKLEESTVEAGRVGFDVHNDAKVQHEFVVFETDLAADRLPLGKDGDVVEDSPQLHNIADSGSSIDAGTSRAVFATLSSGHYAVVCNLPGHYHLGMHVDLTVN
jgi:uncharacterized cupredoxin-like copper-binding protein